MTHDEIIAVIQHHVKGGEIEYRVKGLSTWQAAATPNWDFSRYDFRAKPEPMVVYVEFNSQGKPMNTELKPPVSAFKRVVKKFVEVTE